MKIRQSEITTYSDCRRKHHFRYTLGLVPKAESSTRPRTPGSREVGTAAHSGFAMLNLGGSLERAQNWALSEMQRLAPEVAPEEVTNEWVKAAKLAMAIVGHYHEWQEDGNDVGVHFDMVEQDFEEEIGKTGLDVYGKIDAVYRDPLSGKLVVRDFKTVNNFSQVPEEVDFQLRTYAWAVWKLTNEVPARVEHLMVKRVLGTGNAKRPFVQRHQIPFNGLILDRHQDHLYQRAFEAAQARSIPDAEDSRLWPNPSQECSWKCDYRDVCPMVDDGSDWQGMLEDLYEPAPE